MGQTCTGLKESERYTLNCYGSNMACCGNNTGAMRVTVSDLEHLQNQLEVSMPEIKNFKYEIKNEDSFYSDAAIEQQRISNQYFSPLGVNSQKQRKQMFAVNSHKLNSSKDRVSQYNRTTVDKYASNTHEKEQTYEKEYNNLMKVEDQPLPDGSLYTGFIKMGSNNSIIKYGKGTQVWKDGAKYEGEWRDGKANGKGTFYHTNGDIYEGEFKDDKACGYGVYYHKNGSRYQGQWKNDLKEGYGREEWEDGAFYEGHFKESQKNGQGKYKWADGSSYSGEWKENMIHGNGRYEWTDGRVYDGGWKENKLHGRGLYIWPDGRSYEGDYIEDKKEGFGIYKWPDGRRYEGPWRNGKQDGQALFVNKKGKQRTGVWQNGARIKWIDKNESRDQINSSQVFSNGSEYNAREVQQSNRVDSH